MKSKLLIISLLGLACTINGQGTDSKKPIANVPAPSNQLTLSDDLPSTQEIAINRASGNSGQDILSAIQSQMAAESARDKMENEMANQAMRKRIEDEARMAKLNFPQPPEARSTQLLPTGWPRPTDMGASTSRSSGTQSDGQISVGNIQARICFNTFFLNNIKNAKSINFVIVFRDLKSV